VPRNFYTYSDSLEGKMLVDQIKAEEPDVLIVSNSQLNSWNRCEMQYQLGYVEQWTEINVKPYLWLGNLGHEALATYYRSLMGGLDRSQAVDAVQEKLKEQFNEWAFKTDAHLPSLATMSWLVTKYIEQFTPHADADLQEVLGVEEHFIIALLTPKGQKFYLQGYVDVRAQMRDMMWIWDHKFSGKFWMPTEVQMDAQQPTYAAAFTFGVDLPVYGTIINMLKTYDYKDKSKVSPEQVFKREWNFHTKEALWNTLVEIGQAVDDLYRWKAEGLRARLSRECSRCWFQQPCHLGLQGHNMQLVLSTEYRKKGETDNQEGEWNDELDDIHL
jgi:hypothetical protein